METILLYYVFSFLFMIGYVDTNGMKWWIIVLHCLLMLIIAPIVFPINVGYHFHKIL